MHNELHFWGYESTSFWEKATLYLAVKLSAISNKTRSAMQFIHFDIISREAASIMKQK